MAYNTDEMPQCVRDGELVDALIRLYQIEMAAAAFNASPAYVLMADIPYVVGALDRERATQKAVVARMIEAARSNGEAPDGDAP